MVVLKRFGNASRCFSFLGLFLLTLLSLNAIPIFGQTYPQYPQQQYPQYPQYPQNGQYDPYGGNENPYDNYSTKTPFKTEVGRLEASVYRAGKEPLPLMQVPRLIEGDVLKVKVLNEAVNGIMPEQSNWDWTLMVAFINPSKQFDKKTTLSEEIRLKERGWYNDYFFTVPYDSQPIIFLYPKSKYRGKILELIEKQPDEVRQMGEKIIEIGGAYAQISSFLYQLQYLMARPDYGYGYGGYNYGGGYGGGYGGNGYGTGGKVDNYLEQSIEGLARTFNLQMPSCWRTMQYSNNMAMRAQCVSRNVRLEDLNFSVGRMLQQGGLFALSQLRNSHPSISKWIALAAVAIDFIMKFTRKTSIRIIPAIVSSQDNPLYFQNSYYQNTYGNNGYNQYPQQQNTAAYPNYQNNLQSSTSASKVSLFANMQPNDRDFVTIYAFVPHKWQPNADPEVFNLYAPQMTEPCLHAGKNILRNTDMRIEWLADNFSRNFKLVLSDQSGWKKEFELKKNLGLNAWEADITKDDMAMIPKNSVPLVAKISGTRGFNPVDSPEFMVPISSGGSWEAEIRPLPSGKSKVVLRKISGDMLCSQNILYKPAGSQQVMFPVVKDNNFLKISDYENEISFEIDSNLAKPESIQIQQFGGDMLPVTIKP